MPWVPGKLSPGLDLTQAAAGKDWPYFGGRRGLASEKWRRWLALQGVIALITHTTRRVGAVFGEKNSRQSLRGV